MIMMMMMMKMMMLIMIMMMMKMMTTMMMIMTRKYKALRKIVDSWGTVTNDTYIESVAGRFNDL